MSNQVLRLVTLGGLRLENNQFSRHGRLLLLAYLALESDPTKRSRRSLGSLFWIDTGNPNTNLRMAISDIHQQLKGALEEHDKILSTTVSCDAVDFYDAVKRKNWTRANELYSGEFLSTVEPDDDATSELNLWVENHRTKINQHMVQVNLELARQCAVQKDYQKAASFAAMAWKDENDPDVTSRGYEPDELEFIHSVLVLGKSHHDLVLKVRANLEVLGLTVQTDAKILRLQFEPKLIGRKNELKQLQNLSDQSWAWISGGVWMGKSKLLQSLSGTLVTPKADFSYAALESLLGDAIFKDKTQMLTQLRSKKSTILVEDWHLLDARTKDLFKALNLLRSDCKVIISSRDDAEIKVDLVIALKPLTEQELKELTEFPDAWQKTAGIPILVDALLHQESLGSAFHDLLEKLTIESRNVYFGAVVLGIADLALLRSALELSNHDIQLAVQELQAAGLFEQTQDKPPRVEHLALSELKSQGTKYEALSLGLARQINKYKHSKQTDKNQLLFSLYRNARALWDNKDILIVQDVYFEYIQGLLNKGRALDALEIVDDLEPNAEVNGLRATILERLGRFKDALDVLATNDSLKMAGFKSTLLLKLGFRVEAERIAILALAGNVRESKAHAYNTLGTMCFSQGQVIEASEKYRQAAALWRILSQPRNLAASLKNYGTTQLILGQDGLATYREALEIAKEDRALCASINVNIGKFYQDQSKMHEAELEYINALQISREVHEKSVETIALNNLGALYHFQDRFNEAQVMYSQALQVVEQTQDEKMLSMILANFSELKKDDVGFKIAIDLLELGGYLALTEEVWSNLKSIRLTHP